MSNTEQSVQFFDATLFLDTAEVLRLTGLSPRELAELVDLGLLQDLDQGRYAGHVVRVGRRAAQLREVFELDTSGLALAVSLLARIEDLEARVRDLSLRLPR